MFSLLLVGTMFFTNDVKTVDYDTAVKLSKEQQKKVVVFVGCDVIEFTDSKNTVVVHLNKTPNNTHWSKYDGKIVVGEWQSNGFAVSNVFDSKTVDSTFLLPKEIVQQIPQQYRDCPSCQQQFLNKLRR